MEGLIVKMTRHHPVPRQGGGGVFWGKVELLFARLVPEKMSGTIAMELDRPDNQICLRGNGEMFLAHAHNFAS